MTVKTINGIAIASIKTVQGTAKASLKTWGGEALGNTYATWNPSDKNASLTLSNGNLTAQGDATWRSGRATISKSSGKWYWEVRFDTSVTHYVMVGIGLSSASIADGAYPGKDVNGHGYLDLDGNKYNNDVSTAYGALYVQGDIVGVALDMDGGTLIMYKNNVSQGTLTSGLSGSFFPMIGVGAQGTGAIITANFGATALTYTPPAGYNAGVYT